MTTTLLAYLPSPSQGVWHLGPVPLRAYALCIITGIVAALIIGDRRWEARGGERGVIYDIALWAVPFGLVGGRLYHVMTDWQTYFGAEGKGLGAAFQIWEGGLGIWGAVALGAVGAWIGCRRRGIPLPAFGDAIAPGIILAQAIGRLGNYFNQELYGRVTTLPWGLEIYDRRNAVGARDDLNGVSNGDVLAVVHPTFLYELLWNLLIFVVLLWADRRFKLGHGRLFALYVAGYCVGRFWVELMRSDMATHLAGIRINTFTSTFVFIGAVVYIMLAPKGREDPSSLTGDLDEDEESPIDDLGKELVTVASTSGVVAAAAAAGKDDVEDDADHMHVDDVTTSEGAEAAAAVELKAIVPRIGDADAATDEAETAKTEPGEAEIAEDVPVDDAEAVAEGLVAEDAEEPVAAEDEPAVEVEAADEDRVDAGADESAVATDDQAETAEAEADDVPVEEAEAVADEQAVVAGGEAAEADTGAEESAVAAEGEPEAEVEAADEVDATDGVPVEDPEAVPDDKDGADAEAADDAAEVQADEDEVAGTGQADDDQSTVAEGPDEAPASTSQLAELAAGQRESVQPAPGRLRRLLRRRR